MIKARFGEKLDRVVQQLFPFLFRRELNPNLLTLVGVALSLVAAGFLATGSFLSGGLLLLCGGFFVRVMVAMHRSFIHVRIVFHFHGKK